MREDNPNGSRSGFCDAGICSRLGGRFYATFGICLICGTTLHATTGYSKPNQQLAAIARAVGAETNVMAGRGHATVTVEHSMHGTEQYDIDFAFKTNRSRSYIQAVLPDGTSRLQAVWIRNPTRSIVYNGEYATIDGSASAGFDHELGQDFHAGLFSTIPYIRKSISEELETLIELQGEKSVTVASDGLVKIEFRAHYPDEGWSRLTMHLDSMKDYRLVFFEDRTGNLNGQGSENTYRLSIVWQKTSAGWYPRTIVHEEAAIDVLGKGTISPAPYSYRQHISIDALDTECTIADQEFEIDGLNLAEGTLILDKILGMQYRFGESPIGEIDLDEALASADIVLAKAEHLERPTEYIASTTQANAVPPLRPSKRDHSVPPAVAGESTEDKGTIWIVYLVTIVITVALGSFAIFLRRWSIRSGK